MRRALAGALVVAVAGLAGGAGCRGCGPAATAPKPTSCARSADCAAGWVCLDGQCADPSAAAPFTDPEKAVTAPKVGREVGKTLEHEQERSLEEIVK